jgi:hypothetical protein
MPGVDHNKENVGLLLALDKNQKSINHFNNNNNNDSVTTTASNSNQIDWLDKVVDCAQILNKIFTRNTCRLCHVYSDKQVEFEERIQENATIAATAAGWYMNNNNNYYNDYDNSSENICNQQELRPSVTLPMSIHGTAIDPHVVELYRQQLFDEESVVDSIELRMVQGSTDDVDVDNNNNIDRNDEHDALIDVQLV